MMLPFDISDPALLAVVAATMLFGGLVHGTLGLGFPVVATPILAAFFDVHAAILLTLLPTLTVNVASIRGAGRRWLDVLARYWPLALCGLAGGILGTWVLTVSPSGPFRLLLAALILLFLWASRSGARPVRWIVSRPRLAMVAFGALAGFSAGTTNVMVAVLLIYVLSLSLPRPESVALMNTCFMIGKLAQVGVLSAAGLVTPVLLAWTAPLAAVALGALLVGQRLRERIPVEVYRRLLRHLLAALAVLLVVQFALAPL